MARGCTTLHSRLDELTVYATSSHSFDVCARMVRPEVLARVVVLAWEQAEAATGVARDALVARAQWWTLVAEAATS